MLLDKMKALGLVQGDTVQHGTQIGPSLHSQAGSHMCPVDPGSQRTQGHPSDGEPEILLAGFSTKARELSHEYDNCKHSLFRSPHLMRVGIHSTTRPTCTSST